MARTAQLIDGRVTFGETHLFVGKGYIVSVRHGASTSYSAVRQHWESCPTSLAKGEDFILYAILDFIVDNYMPVLEAIEDEVDAIEDRVLVKPMTAADIERLYMLRRDLPPRSPEFNLSRTSGSSCAITGSRTGSSRDTTTSSPTAAPPGATSSTSLGASAPSEAEAEAGRGSDKCPSGVRSTIKSDFP